MTRKIPPTPENIRAALSYLSPDVDRAAWVKIGAAVKDGLGHDGFGLFDDWSKRGHAYNATDCRDAWKSLKNNGQVTVGSLFFLARKAGWTPEGEAHQETEAERLERERQRQARAERDAKEQARREREAARKAAALWKAGTPLQADHGYLVRKGIQPVSALREISAEHAAGLLGYAPKSDGEPLAGRLIVVPVKIGGKLVTAELIDEAGRKSALAGGPKSSGLWAAPPLPQGDGAGRVLLIGEGVATVLTATAATGHAAVAALSAGNLPKVAQALREGYPAARLVILGDLGGGLKYAERAAKAAGVALAVPDFTGLDVGETDTDFNDLSRVAGLDAVRGQIEAALTRVPEAKQPKTAKTGTPPEIENPGGTGGTYPDPPDNIVPTGAAEAGTPPGKLVEFPGAGQRRRRVNGVVVDETDAGEPEPERPSYVVREDWSRFGPPGVWFHTHKSGGKGDPEPLNLWFSSPLYVEAVTCTDDGRCFGRRLRFRDTFGHWRTWAMPMEMLRGSCEELRGELLTAGVHIDYKERARLADYLQWKTPQRRITAAIRTGWTRDGHAFVLPEQVIGSADVFYQAETMHQDGAADKSGDFATWQAEIAARCVGNPVLALSVCVALAGPLLAKVHRDSGGLHWVGDSSTGKTTALNVACSVWGGETFRRTWRATANGLEGAAAALNDTCLCLDEINEADPREIGSIVYALGNGTGKTRANRMGSARQVFRWRLTLLSTGERTLAAQMAEGNKQPKAGQLVRLLNVPTARQHGAFDELHGFPEGRALADHIKTVCGRHYGYAGPAFIEALLEDGRDFGAALAEVENLPQFKADVSQEARAASRFALYGMAGELAQEWGLLPWPQGEALSAAAEAYRLWREARGGGSTEDRQILQATADFISKHGDSRFSRKAAEDEDQPQPVVMQRAGWWIDLDGVGRVYLFTSEALREATKGHDFKRALDALDSAGWIHDRDRNEEGKRAKKTAIGKRKPWLYWILPGDLDE
jgi:putative DNA primase/helicase